MKENNKQGLYRPEFESDACGIGFVANLKGEKSHKIIADAINMLQNMEHRGACGCEPDTGDGAGVLFQLPDEFFQEECPKLGFNLPPFGQYGVAMTFLPPEQDKREACLEIFQSNAKELGFNILGSRHVPKENNQIGATAQSVEPICMQFFVTHPDGQSDPMDLERKLFVLRSYTTHKARKEIKQTSDSFYFTSFSSKTIVYKGQLTTWQLRPYYKDLSNPKFKSALATIHSRFSTNTIPKWKLAQPFRYIAHNGEINTIKGNVNWMKSKEARFASELFTPEEFEKITPICHQSRSDSANLDNIIELLVLSGRSLPHALMMVIPEAWEEDDKMQDPKKAFYEYHASIMEPWDGPASICFTDGEIVGATLDRNGLRPSRYCLLDDDTLIMASEAGALKVDQSKVVLKGRLKPGRMFVADLKQHRIISDEELKNDICSQKPYREWLTANKKPLDQLPKVAGEPLEVKENELLIKQQAHGFTSEDLKEIIKPMTSTSKEPIGSMGADTPLAILSEHSQHISHYFKQHFAQVSNPPIDPIRERLVMSLYTGLGVKQNILEATPEHCRLIHIKHPVLKNDHLAALVNYNKDSFLSRKISITFDPQEPNGLEKGIDRICNEAERAVKDSVNLILLSDRDTSSSLAPIPSLMATGAVHHHLIKIGMKTQAALLVEAGDVRETQHFATLLGYGAHAINPYLTFESIADLHRKGKLDKGLSLHDAIENYINAINYGLLKVFSKMGISTLKSYQGAQVFEAVGVGASVIDKCFYGTVSRIGGLDFEGFSKEILTRHRLAYYEDYRNTYRRLEVGGLYQWKRRGEFHLFNPETIHLLQNSTRKGDYNLYKKYAEKINNQERKASTLRSLLAFNYSKARPIPIEEVEPLEAIFKRFATGAMSFGSISHEAHSTLAIAMNAIGGKSNSGEGGEDEARFARKEDGTWECSAIKQVASGRFGVSSYYLTNAKELQIKMAQGAKPGEGGQLPGHKVDEWIGRVRNSTPGVGLISPPPHHDIYSIEDLAQLIYDLKNANRQARINVKLVSKAGVGTIAAGVAKAHADVILISGHDGGTGASPLSSIRHAGMPWEIGLAEAHQNLVRNNLRSRVTLQTDGQLKTGRDLAVAALLGAEEFGVSTAALVTEGCIMMRKCHLNTCPVGVATQNPELRKLFTGKPEHVINLFTFMAEELREIMASLGFKTVNEMVGQASYLKENYEVGNWKRRYIDLSELLHEVNSPLGDTSYKSVEQDHGIDNVLDWQLLEEAKDVLDLKKDKIKAEFEIVNTKRSVGALISNEISKKFHKPGLPEDSLHFVFKGSAGQSFGAFAAPGLFMELIGEANDYIGKGLSGGKIVVYPEEGVKFKPEENQIAGNVCLYGATAGHVYLNGMAGERFAVRNSGAEAVVEGVGDHGCEYMTGGRVLNIGSMGKNFAAGMSGGIAYLLIENEEEKQLINPEMVDLDPLDEQDEQWIQSRLQQHIDYTGSPRAQQVLSNWQYYHSLFVKVFPREYKAILQKSAAEQAAKSVASN
ncbi:MAG: glutamate synthase large subunit [Cyclobacteriaceae bacterium]|nr:glutamate synthase large subunit [Cyclobacteriaceae bacterium]MCH8517233.1 glutamate synthase large subunit [Cyclobacteriaceae bacterium]